MRAGADSGIAPVAPARCIMCLAVPGEVREIYEANGVLMGKVNFGGIAKEVCLAYVPDIRVGEYTIVHVGFALQRIDETSAKETLEMFRQLGTLEEELGEAGGEDAGAGP